MVRKVLKWLKRVVLLAILLIVVGGLSLYLYVENSIGIYASDEALEQVISNINSARELPYEFFKVRRKYFSEDIENTLWLTAIKAMFNLETSTHCECRMSAYNNYTLLDKRNDRIKIAVLQAYLENNVSDEQCFEYNFQNMSFGHSRGIENLLERHYKKTIDLLTERELIELLVIQQANTRYNPMRNPENLKRKVDAIIERQEQESL